MTQIACTLCLRCYIVIGQNVLSTTQIRSQHSCPLTHILWTLTHISDADAVCRLANSMCPDLCTGSARFTFWAWYTGISQHSSVNTIYAFVPNVSPWYEIYIWWYVIICMLSVNGRSLSGLCELWSVFIVYQRKLERLAVARKTLILVFSVSISAVENDVDHIHQ